MHARVAIVYLVSPGVQQYTKEETDPPLPMFDGAVRNVRSYQPESGPFLIAIVLFSINVALAVTLWWQLGSLTSVRCIGILEGNYSFTGRLDMGSSSMHWDFEYNIPAGALQHISIRGPLRRGIGAGPPDYALTLCGGDQPCSSVEAITCEREHPHTPISDCARLADTLDRLDSTSPDAGSSLHRTLEDIREHGNLYIVVVEANNQSFRQPIGPICRKSVSLPTVAV